MDGALLTVATDRLETRIDPAVKRMAAAAAKRQGRSLSNFVERELRHAAERDQQAHERKDGES